MTTAMAIPTTIAALTTYAAIIILYVVGKWSLFKKMDLAGWKAFVPFYSEYLIFKKTWSSKMFFVSLATALTANVLSQFAVNGSQTNTALVFAAITVAAVSLIIDVKLLHKLAKTFGHGLGYTVGLIVAQPLFTMILGFGKSEYAAA